MTTLNFRCLEFIETESGKMLISLLMCDENFLLLKMLDSKDMLSL